MQIACALRLRRVRFCRLDRRQPLRRASAIRFACLSLAVLAGPLAAQGPVETLAPASSETLTPFRAEVMVQPGEAEAPPPGGPASTLDPELYAALKAAAERSPNAEVPDEFVPLVFPRKDRSLSEAGGEPEGLSLATSSASVVRSFAGLDHAASVGSDGLFRPPDTTLGKSGSRVLEGTNSALRLFMSSGSLLATKSLNDFFGAAAADGVVFDPRVVYDRLGPNQRLFVIALQRNEALKTASIFISVSRSANPSDLVRETTPGGGSWCGYKLDSVRDQATIATWADFPMVGVGADAFLISNDQFTFDQDPDPTRVDYDYKYGILRVIRKDLITNNATGPCPAAPMSLFLLPITLTGTAGSSVSLGHVHPAVHYTAPSSFSNVTNPVYMVSTVVPPSTTYKVWRVRNAASGTPLVDVKTLAAINLYDMPVAALQPYPGPALDTNDVRIMQAVALGDTLWATHVTNCLQPNGINKPCIRVVKVFVGDSGGTLSASFQHDVTFASLETDTGLAYYMPGLAVNSSQHTAISFLASSPTMYQGAAWTWKFGLDQVYAPATVFASGSCIRASGKIGDYVGAQTNPNDLVSFWLAGEAAAPSGQGCNWRTQIIQVTP